MSVYEFHTKPISYEGICWVSVLSYLSLGILNKGESLGRHFLCPSLKFCYFMSFKQKPILMKTFVQLQFQVMSVYEFQTKVNSHADICWVSVWSYVFYEFQTKSNSYEDNCWFSVWSYVRLWVSNESEFLWINLLSLSLKLWKFISFKQKRILMNTFVQPQFEVM